MHLNKLVVLQNNQILREVAFNKGLNLVLNKASSSEHSGNSVGKTTLSRLIDYLLLSDGQDIYTEPEFNKEIPEIVSLITENEVVIQLFFISYDQAEHIIARNLVARNDDNNKNIFYYDNSEINKKEYENIIKSKVLGTGKDKPSVRQATQKFIRNTNEKMQNTTQFLNKYATNVDYDLAFLYLFGIDVLDQVQQKKKIDSELKSLKKFLTAYRKPHHENILERMLKPLEKEKAEIEKRINEIDFVDSNDKSIKELVVIQNDISKLSLEYSNLKARIEFLKNSIQDIEKHKAKRNLSEIKYIYENAGSAISTKLEKSYEDLLLFHDKIVGNKLKLVNLSLQEKSQKASSIKEEIHNLQEKEAAIFKKVQTPDTLKSINEIYNTLLSVSDKISSTETLLEQINTTKNKILSKEEALEEISEKIHKKSDDLKGKVDSFNEFFGEFSKKFYNDTYIFNLDFDQEKKHCSINIVSVTPNATGGKKKGELSAFDFAYIEFVNSIKLKRPKFVIHDGIEDIDHKQIYEIFNVADKLNGQYIVSILRDKISDNMFSKFIENNTVLELSEDDKFFKIS